MEKGKYFARNIALMIAGGAFIVGPVQYGLFAAMANPHLKKQLAEEQKKVDGFENQVLVSEITKTLNLFPADQVIDNNSENERINKFIKETSCGIEYLIPKKGPNSGKTTAEINVYSGNRLYEGKCACDWQQISGTSTTLTFHMPKKQGMQYLARRNIHPF